MATMYTARHYKKTAAILALTHSGATSKWVSRTIPGIPVYAVTPHATTARRVAMYRGVHPILFNFDLASKDTEELQAIEKCLADKIIEKNDTLLVTKGDKTRLPGGTNTMKILTA